MRKNAIWMIMFIVITSLLLSGCGSSTGKTDEGLVFRQPKNIGGYSFLEFCKEDNVYICDIDDVTATDVVIPATYRNKPVVAVIGRNNETLHSLKIEEGIRYIENVTGFPNLKALELPETISMMKNAFERCGSLENVVIRGDIETIAGSSFQYCTSLKSVVFTGDVGVITDFSFNGLSNLSEVSFGGNLGTIEKYAFNDCPNLINMDLPSSVTVDDSAWNTAGEEERNAGLQFREDNDDGYICDIGEVTSADVVVPATYRNKPVVEVRGSVDGNDALRSLKISDGIEVIERISGYTNLETVELPETISLLYDAFWECPALEEVVFRGDVEKIAGSSFRDCTSLTSVEFQGDVGVITELSFNGCSNLSSVSFHGKLEALEDKAFKECPKLVSMEFPVNKEVEEYSAGFDNEVLLASALPVLGTKLDPSKEAGNWRELADIYYGPVVATRQIPDCSPKDYGPDRLPQDQSLYVVSLTEVEFFHPDTMYHSVAKAVGITDGNIPRTYCLFEYTGYGDGPEYFFGGSQTKYLYYRVSLWDYDHNELIAWYSKRAGYAPNSYVMGRDKISFSREVGDQTMNFFLTSEGDEIEPRSSVMGDIYSIPK